MNNKFTELQDKIEVRIAFPLENDFEELTDRVNALAGRSCDWSGAGASWAGCGMRDMGWLCDTFDEAQMISTNIGAIFPSWPFNIRETTTSQ